MVEEIYRAQNKNTDYSATIENWVTQHPYSFQNISSTNLHLRIFSLLNNKYNINSYNIKLYACSPLCQINFNLLENFVDIINNKYGLLIGAKYHDSNMNDVHTMSLYDIVSCPQK